MTAKKALLIVLGVLMVLIGGHFIFSPASVGMSMGWIMGFVMLFDGIGGIIDWNAKRKAGVSDAWSLVSAVLSLVFGVLVTTSVVSQLLVGTIMAYAIAAWLVVAGIFRMVIAWRMRSFKEIEAVSKSWILVMVLGVLLLLIGIFCFINPLIVFATIGLFIGLGAVVAGVSVVCMALKMQAPEGK